ncbi:MAG TPA: META domain-containing protein [Burkholderiales bacterium]
MSIRKIASALIAVLCSCAGFAVAAPIDDCASSSVPLACLEAKLKAASQQLNATLKAAQERLEQMQAQGRRPVLGAFIDSQRKFNAYRDAQCNWQGIRADSAVNSALYVKDCQIRATLMREQELAEFVAQKGEPAVTAAAPIPAEPEPAIARSAEVPVAQQPAVQPAPPVAQPDQPASPAASATTGSRGIEWHLVRWLVNGMEKTLVPESSVTVAFDPSGKIAGNASVNRFAGTYRFDQDGRLEWPRAGFSVTRSAGPQPLMAQERTFLDSLRRTTQYRVDGQELVLESASGATVLVFTR